MARQWNELLLLAIRNDFARPTVHARNLFHVSVAMYDAWAAYDSTAQPFLIQEQATAGDIEAARAEAISFAAYRVLRSRFANSPGAGTSLPSFDAKITALGYDKDFTSTVGDFPAALGNRIAQAVLAFGVADNSNEAGGYGNLHYAPVNEALVVTLPGNPNITDPDRWQPLALSYFIDQGGNVIPTGYPPALTPEWGQVTPFSLSVDDLTIYHRDDFDYFVYHDPGPPPLINGAGAEEYKWGYEQVVIWSSHLDPADGIMWDISPASCGNSPLPDPADYQSYYDLLAGGDSGNGYSVNPVTGQPYQPQVVPRGDFARVLAEFWADGPSSETPPGHWFTILNYVSDHPLVEKRFEGVGPIVGDLEWDVKSYLTLGGALHDVAVSVWGAKGWYDTIRPVSAIRYMADQGQSSNPGLPHYHPHGIHLYPGTIELITAQSSAPGQRHAHLADHVDEIAIRTWRGPSYITNPATDVAGVGWILAANWWPYQRPTFVSPPFPGYTSGHSAYSRAGAEVLTLLTGNRYFPGGLGEFVCPQNQYLVFEEGPSVTITLQWASYYDAADQSALSRIWGGIHPGQDDLPSRRMGSVIGIDAYFFAKQLFCGAEAGCLNVPLADSSGVDKARFISFSIPAAAAAPVSETALRVNLVSLHHVVPPYSGGASIPFTSFEGEVRWVGPPTQYVESSASGVPFFASRLQCDPHYQDWSTVGLLHVSGSAITPSSIYEVENVAASCIGNEANCTAVSAPLSIATTRWGDVRSPYNPPSPTVQPDISDVSALVDKFRNVPEAPIKARGLLAGEPGNPFGEITPAVLNVDLGFSHISACVDAFRGVPYPYMISSCP